MLFRLVFTLFFAHLQATSDEIFRTCLNMSKAQPQYQNRSEMFSHTQYMVELSVPSSSNLLQPDQLSSIHLCRSKSIRALSLRSMTDQSSLIGRTNLFPISPRIWLSVFIFKQPLLVSANPACFYSCSKVVLAVVVKAHLTE